MTGTVYIKQPKTVYNLPLPPYTHINPGERLIRAKINPNSNISLTPNMSDIEDANSQTGICPMSHTHKDFLDLQEEN